MRTSVLSKQLVISTLAISILATVASIAGLFGSGPYAMETENWRLQAKGQDVGNLLGVALLLMSVAYGRKGSVRVYLIWLGSLFYFLYAYIVYAVAVHFNSLFLVYVAVIGLTSFTLLAALKGDETELRVATVATKKFAGYTLIAIGLLFGLLWLSEILPAIFTGSTPKSLKEAGLIVNPIHVIDLAIVLPAFVTTGYLALKNRRTGLFYAGPWLTFSVLMGSSIVAAMFMMNANGFAGTLPPMIMVSIVVALSFISLVRYLRDTSVT